MLKEIIKEILKEEFSVKKEESVGYTNSVACDILGKICMFRTYSAGVHFGVLARKNNQECLVRNSRRIFYWTKACSLSQLAIEGSKDIKGCKIAMELPEIVLDQVIEVIPMSESAIKILSEASVWKN